MATENDSPLRPVEWAQEVLGHKDAKTTYAWLKRENIPVKAGLIHVDVFYDAWRPERLPETWR